MNGIPISSQQVDRSSESNDRAAPHTHGTDRGRRHERWNEAALAENVDA